MEAKEVREKRKKQRTKEVIFMSKAAHYSIVHRICNEKCQPVN
jgi:hypothetical protein